MSDKELLKAIQNDIKNIDEYIETCIDEDTIYYLYLIKQDMLIFKLELLKRITINKLFKEKQMNNQTTPTHYQGTIQPIDLINAQNLNFNLGNVVKYVCRAGKKQGENVLSDLDKAKNYINFEIERIKNEKNDHKRNDNR